MICGAGATDKSNFKGQALYDKARGIKVVLLTHVQVIAGSTKVQFTWVHWTLSTCPSDWGAFMSFSNLISLDSLSSQDHVLEGLYLQQISL